MAGSGALHPGCRGSGSVGRVGSLDAATPHRSDRSRCHLCVPKVVGRGAAWNGACLSGSGLAVWSVAADRSTFLPVPKVAGTATDTFIEQNAQFESHRPPENF